MANTIAIAQGFDKSGRVKRTSRLGSEAAEGHANTWRTFASVYTKADGSVYVSVRRDGATVHTFNLGPESER